MDLIDFASAIGQAATAAALSLPKESTEPSLSAPEMRPKGARLIIPGFTIPGGNWVMWPGPLGMRSPCSKT